jgi:2-polyprenyl-6-methoxyphenol hydroxylase-like FAD-dependent oxidoreductase
MHVVGGGIAGLALAASVPAGWRIHLHEQAWDAPSVPTALGMWPGAMKVLAGLGLADRVRAVGRHLTRGRVHDVGGHLFARSDSQDVWLVARPDLVAMLRDRLPDAVEIHHRTVTDGELPDGDVVVGADGVHSVVRRAVWDDAPVPLGGTAIRGVAAVVPAGASLEEFWGRGVMMGTTPHPHDETNWFVVVPRRRFAGTADALDHARARLAAAPARAQDVLRAAEPARTLVNDLWASRSTSTIVRGRAVLVGDAAHAMAPNLGRGACEALVDAAALGAALAADHDVPTALRRYQRRRVLVGQGVRWASGTVLRVATTRRDGLRDPLLRAVGAPTRWTAPSR